MDGLVKHTQETAAHVRCETKLKVFKCTNIQQLSYVRKPEKLQVCDEKGRTLRNNKGSIYQWFAEMCHVVST